MATRSVSRRIITRESWKGITYTGFREDLIAAGHLREEWIRPKPYRNALLSTMLADGREIRVYKKGDRLAVEHLFTEAEQDLRREKDKAQRQAEEEHNRAEREIAAWPTSKTDYARRLEIGTCNLLEVLHGIAMNGFGGGYKVAPRYMPEINEACKELVDVMRAAEIAFDPGERQRAEAKLRGKAASHDPAFGAFLDRAMAPPAAQDGEGEHAHG